MWTCRTVIIPAASALGYIRGKRDEAGVDPNRDFPFDVGPADSDDCLRTIAGRSMNKLFRSHLFPVGLTFHGGMEVVAYEWGAPTYLGPRLRGAQRRVGVLALRQRLRGIRAVRLRDHERQGVLRTGGDGGLGIRGELGTGSSSARPRHSGGTPPRRPGTTFSIDADDNRGEYKSNVFYPTTRNLVLP